MGWGAGICIVSHPATIKLTTRSMIVIRLLNMICPFEGDREITSANHTDESNILTRNEARCMVMSDAWTPASQMIALIHLHFEKPDYHTSILL